MATAKTNGGSGGGGGEFRSFSTFPDLLALAERDDEMVVAYDADFRYTYINPATERLIGPRENFLGRVLWEVTPHSVGTRYAEHYLRAMRERVVVEFEEHYPPRDRWNRVLCVPTADGGLVIRARDITAGHRAELAREDALQSLRQSEERHRRLVELLPEALYVNYQDRIVLANPAFLRLVGATDEAQVRDRPPFDFFHPDDHGRIRERVWRMLERDQPVPPIEKRVLRLDGTTVDVEAVGVPFPLDGRTMIQVVLRDISARKAAEAELRAAHAQASARAEREMLVNRIGQAMRAVAEPDEVLSVAVRALGEALGADRCYLIHYEPGRDRGRIGPDWHRDGAGLSPLAGEYRLSDFSVVSADPVYAAGRTQVIADIREHARRAFPDGGVAESVGRLERLGLRALARAPLSGSEGVLAALVVAMAGGPRRWTDDEVAMVEAVAAQARAAVEAARARRELEADRAKQRRIAEALQRSLLIAPAPDAFAGAEVFPYYEAAGDEAQVGGDAYDVVRLDGGRVGLCLVDITGHGTDAALFSADVRFSARNYLREGGGDPAECLRRLNRHVLDGQRLDGKPENVFVCAIVAVLDPATGALSLAAAGMEPPLILRAASGDVEAAADVSGPILGALPEWPGAAADLTLDACDTLLLYTDGLSEARRGKDDFFGVEGVAAALAAAGPAAPLEETAGALVAVAKSFARSGVLDDDLCLLLCRRLGA